MFSFRTRNPVLANLKILARFYQILSYGLTLKVTSPPILTISFDAHTYTLTTYGEIEHLWKKVYFYYGALKKGRSFFLKELVLDRLYFKNGKR